MVGNPEENEPDYMEELLEDMEAREEIMSDIEAEQEIQPELLFSPDVMELNDMTHLLLRKELKEGDSEEGQ